MNQYRAVEGAHGRLAAGSAGEASRAFSSSVTGCSSGSEALKKNLRTGQRRGRAEGLEMSFEDLRNTNEEILVSLQHKETLVLELKEMLKSMASESKEERMKTLEEDTRQQECQDTIRLLQSQITSLSEERDTLRRDVECLSAAQCRIAEILQQSFSETEVDGASDISTLVERLWTQAQEERAVLRQRLEEAGEEQAARIHELLREKDLLKASLEDVLLDTEGLQKDLREMQAMNVKLRAENHSLLSQVADLSRSLEEKEKESPDESDAQLHEAGELQQVLADRDTLISQLREEVGHLQVLCVCDAG